MLTQLRSIAFPANIALVGTTAAAWMLGASALAASRPGDVPFATPAGITLVDVSKGDYGARDEFLWRRLGDSQGNALYTYNKDGNSGKSNCLGECAKEFPPFLAPKGAVAYGDWSLVSRSEGQQWAYLGQPLYGYVGRGLTELEENTGNDTGRGFAAAFDPGGKNFSPRGGWKQAVYDPTKTVSMPADVRLQCLEAGSGYGFVLAPTGMPIYILNSEPKDSDAWAPLYASSLALPVGDFSIVRRADGTHQWAYKGQRLYSFNGDYSPSDINGLVAQKDARLALAYRLFMPAALAINVFPARPPMMTTVKGLGVYTEARYHLQYGGRESRGGYHYTYNDAKVVGTRGCIGECTRTWQPVMAPAKAQGWGFWELASRADGSKQWAYKGSPLYTYVEDKAPGDIKGNNRDVIVYGDSEGRTVAVLGDGFSGGKGGGAASSTGSSGAGASDLMSLTGATYIDPHANYGGSFGAGFYWHLVPLYN